MKREAPKPQTREEAMDARAAEDMRAMDAANARPIDPALLAAEPWQSKGGACGFTWNGQPVVVARRVVRRKRMSRK